MPDICFLGFAHVRHLRQNFGTHTTMYGNIITVETWVLKNNEPELSHILAELFNKCLKES